MMVADILAWPSFLLFVFLFILGACIGSFINVIIIRLPKFLMKQEDLIISELLHEKNIVVNNEKVKKTELAAPHVPDFFKARSCCLFCQKDIYWYDNIPIMSFVLLKGKCRHCATKISRQYFVVELLSAFVFVIAGVSYSASAYLLNSIEFISLLAFFSALISLGFIDFRHKILPDEITLPFIWIGLIVNINSPFAPLSQAVLGAVIGYLVLWILFQIHFRMTGRYGLGYGDFKLTSMIGAWLGVLSLPVILLIASITGLFYYALIFIINKYHHHQSMTKQYEIPFGPCLSFASILYVLLFSNKAFIMFAL